MNVEWVLACVLHLEQHKKQRPPAECAAAIAQFQPSVPIQKLDL
jgi:hypothetical protein